MKKSQNTRSNSIKTIRERLGGSQQWWADYLSLSRSMIKMVESGQRSLPAAALLKLSAIELLPPSPDSAKTNNTKAISGKSTPFTTHIRKLELQLHRLENLLGTTQQRYAQAVRATEVSAQLLQTIGTTEEEQKDKLLLEAMQLQAGRDKEKYGDAAQTLLQWKINCLTYTIATANRLLQGNDAQ